MPCAAKPKHSTGPRAAWLESVSDKSVVIFGRFSSHALPSAKPSVYGNRLDGADRLQWGSLSQCAHLLGGFRKRGTKLVVADGCTLMTQNFIDSAVEHGYEVSILEVDTSMHLSRKRKLTREAGAASSVPGAELRNRWATRIKSWGHLANIFPQAETLRRLRLLMRDALGVPLESGGVDRKVIRGRSPAMLPARSHSSADSNRQNSAKRWKASHAALKKRPAAHAKFLEKRRSSYKKQVQGLSTEESNLRRLAARSRQQRCRGTA